MKQSSGQQPASLLPANLMHYSLNAVPYNQPLATQGELPTGNAVVICERDDIELGQVLSAKLKGTSLKVRAVSYKSLRIHTQFLLEILPEVVIVVLPRLLTIGAEDTELRQAILRLHTVLMSLQHHTPKMLLIAQFGDGQFGLNPKSTQHLEQSGWRSVVATWYTKHPECKIRLIDCESNTRLFAWGDLVVSAIRTPEAFKVIGKTSQDYYQIRPLRWQFEGQMQHLPFRTNAVLIATGARSPIVTMYAATIAQQTGVRLALIDREPMTGVQDTMGQIIQHCQQAGITVRYYACDLGQETAVVTTIKRIQSDYNGAPIETIIHGSTWNLGRLQPDMPSGQVHNEIAPKVLGAVYLTKYLTQLRWWLTVVPAAPLLGGAGDYWSGYADELVDAYLATYQQAQPRLQVLTVALENLAVNTSVEALLQVPSIVFSQRQIFIGEKKEFLPIWGKVRTPGEPEEVFPIPAPVPQIAKPEPAAIEAEPTAPIQQPAAIEEQVVQAVQEVPTSTSTTTEKVDNHLPEGEDADAFVIEEWDEEGLEESEETQTEPSTATSTTSSHVVEEIVPIDLSNDLALTEAPTVIVDAYSLDLPQETSDSDSAKPSADAQQTDAVLEGWEDSFTEIDFTLDLPPELTGVVDLPTPTPVISPDLSTPTQAAASLEVPVTTQTNVPDLPVPIQELSTPAKPVEKVSTALESTNKVSTVLEVPDTVLEEAEVEEPIDSEEDNKSLTPKRRIWLKRHFKPQTTPTNEYLTINEYGQWQVEMSMQELRPVVASIMNAELRILANQVECLDLLADGHQETSTRVYIDDFTANRLVLRYEHWSKKTSGMYYKTAQGSIILGYGVRCLERWLEIPFPLEMVQKIREFLNG